jgi:dipeptidyl aminopeptidase/acylaminoacyl peptidase
MRLTWMAALCLLFGAGASARPYSVDDLLKLESYGQVLVDPQERWAVIDRRGPYEEAKRFWYGFFNNRGVSRVLVVDLERGGAARHLFTHEAGAGYWSGSFSPSGGKLALFRLKDDRLNLGVVDMKSREQRWLPYSVDLHPAHPAPQWVSEDVLVFSVLPEGRLPNMLRYPGLPQRRLPEMWDRAAKGREPSGYALGTGRFSGVGVGGTPRTLMAVNIRTGETQRPFSGDMDDVAISADRGHAAVLSLAEPIQPRHDETITPGFQPRRRRLSLINLKTGEIRDPCSDCDVAPDLLSWSPGSAELLFHARRAGEAWTDGHLYRARPAHAEARRVTGAAFRPEVQLELGSSLVIEAGWSGDRIIARGRAAGSPALAWHDLSGAMPRSLHPERLAGATMIAASGRDDFLLKGDELWSVPAHAKKPRRLFRRVVGTAPEILDPYSLGSRPYFNERPLEPRAIVTSGAGKRTLQPASGRWTLDLPVDGLLVATGRRRAFGMVYKKDTRGVGTIHLIRGGAGPEPLDHINSHLADVDVPTALSLDTVAQDGTRLHHWLFLPRAPAGAKPALVVLPYPGFVYSAAAPSAPGPADFVPEFNPNLVAGLGYAVLMPSIPLQPGGEPMHQIAAPVLAAVEAARKTGLISDRCPATYGHSFGGYAALALGALSDAFCGIVASGAPTDLLALYGSFLPQSDTAESGLSLILSAGWAEGGQGGLGAPPWREPLKYVRNSPFYHAERMKAPVLILHGDSDYVPVSQAERMYFALHRLGKEAELVRYAGEGHVLYSPANLRDEWRRIAGFLRALEPATIPGSTDRSLSTDRQVLSSAQPTP